MGRLRQQQKNRSPWAIDPRSVVVGDFNGDSNVDLAVANNGDDTITILLGMGTGKFTAKNLVKVSDFPQAEEPRSGTLTETGFPIWPW